jgi:hypothetical protein
MVESLNSLLGLCNVDESGNGVLPRCHSCRSRRATLPQAVIIFSGLSVRSGIDRWILADCDCNYVQNVDSKCQWRLLVRRQAAVIVVATGDTQYLQKV